MNALVNKGNTHQNGEKIIFIWLHPTFLTYFVVWLLKVVTVCVTKYTEYSGEWKRKKE